VVGEPLEEVVEGERDAPDRLRGAACAAACYGDCRPARFRLALHVGMNQMLESIGSSVKETNNETSTANDTVTPNWKKSLRSSRHEPTGMNTATTHSRGEHRQPISLVLRWQRQSGLSHLHVLTMFLPHHDRIVDQQSDASDSAAASLC